jgi:hypothetical protein
MFQPTQGDWLGFLLHIACAVILGIAVISGGVELGISMGLPSPRCNCDYLSFSTQTN